MARGLLASTPETQLPHLLLSPQGNSRIGAETEKRGHEPQRALGVLFLVSLGMEPWPSPRPSTSWSLTHQAPGPGCPDLAGEGRRPLFCHGRSPKAQGRNSQAHSWLEYELGICQTPSCFSCPEQHCTFWPRDRQFKSDFEEQAPAKPFLACPQPSPFKGGSGSALHQGLVPALLPGAADLLDPSAEPSAPSYPPTRRSLFKYPLWLKTQKLLQEL